MRISTRKEFVWSERQQKYILLRDVSINWTGPVSLCKGATQQQNDLAAQQADFYKTMQQQQQQTFAGQNAILNNLNTSLVPILAAGVNQFGYSTPEVNVLNAQAVQGTGQQYTAAKQALAAQQAAQGGGNAYLPSGARAAQQASLAASGANTASNQLLGIQQQGYAQGRQNYQTALSGLEGAAGIYNPASMAGQATGAGQSAFSSASEIQKLNAAASPWNTIGGILGGVGSAVLGGMTGGLSNLGTSLISKVPGMGGGISGNTFSSLMGSGGVQAAPVDTGSLFASAAPLPVRL